MEYFNSENLRRVLHGLPDWKRVIFMAACCERMLPNYRSFSSELGYGDASLLSEALSKIWQWIEKSELPGNVEDLIRKCELQAPDTAEFSSIYTSAALDAANSICTTLEALSEATEDKAIEVASLARDTVDLFVQQWNDLDPNAPHFEKRIAEDPLMQTELRKQLESLGELTNQTEDRNLLATVIREKFSDRSLPPRSTSPVS